MMSQMMPSNHTGKCFARTNNGRLTRLTSNKAVIAVEEESRKGYKLQPSKEVLKIWNSAQAVCFDVDSTLCTDESIDEIAAFLGVGQLVKDLTAKAMGGSVKFQDALAMRLDAMKPSKEDIERFKREHPPSLSPGIPELVGKLQERGCQVFLVSGGFRVIIDDIAKTLKLPEGHVFANTILFSDMDGSYTGFDKEEFTSRSGGKAEAIKYIKSKYGYSPMVMVGDGATDLEARQEGGADIFIGYGGVVERKNIAEQADWYTFKIHDLIDQLE